jgi:hypothetical protein
MKVAMSKLSLEMLVGLTIIEKVAVKYFSNKTYF